MGVAAIYELLNHLFDLKISGKILYDAAVIIFIPFNAGIFLSNFPKIETSLDNYEIGKPLRILLEFILMPIMSIYLILLYIYIFKIMFLHQVPKNILVNITLWFGIVAVAYIFFISIIKNSAVLRDFKRIFPVLMLPVLAVTFFSIFLRVKEYGFTENRYLVLVMGIWVFVSMLYYIFYKSNSNITVPITLSIVILLVSIGPLSSYNISLNSQNHRLQAILARNNMINGNKVVPKPDVSQEDREKICEIVKYLTDTHKSYEIKYLPPDFEFNDEDMKNVFGFEIVSNEETYESSPAYDIDGTYPINIEGYSNLFIVDYKSERENGLYRFKFSDDGVDIIINNGNYKNESLVYVDFNDVYNRLKALKKANDIINPEDLAIKGKSHGIEYKVVFTSIYGTNSYDFYLLTKE